MQERALKRESLDRDEDRTVAQLMRDADQRPRSRRAVGQYGLMEDERDPHDNYETPADAVHQLLSHVKLNGNIWDPSCGRGNIVGALLDAGIDRSRIEASDKHHHTPIDTRLNMLLFGGDFMDCVGMCGGSTNIVMNPPFSEADRHVRHALKIVPSEGLVCVLLRLTWMAAHKRSDLLAHLWKLVICGRLKMLPPDVPDQGHSGAVDFAWFVFVPHVVGSTTIVRAR